MPPQRAILLVRISDADWLAGEDGALVLVDGNRVLDRHGVETQIKDGTAYAVRIGWTIAEVIEENDVSAWKRRMCTLPDGRRERRPYRPAFWRAVGLLRDGIRDGLLAIDLDRSTRDPRDLEDLVDLAEVQGVPFESVTGTLRLTTSSDVATARIMVAVASKASADTARRVKEARKRDTAAGRYCGGPRRYGFQPGNTEICEPEARVIRELDDLILRGVNLRQLALMLRARYLTTSRGKQWTPMAIRGVVLNPATAGLLVYRPLPRSGEHLSGHRPWSEDDVIGTAPWPAIVDPDVWRAVTAKLTDPARRTNPGSTPRHLLSLIATCGLCGSKVSVLTGRKGRKPAYACRGCRRTKRNVADVDRLVTAIVVGRLSKPDAADLLPGPKVRDGIEVPALRTQALAYRERLDGLARAFGDGLIDARQLEAGSASVKTKLAAVERELQHRSGRSPLLGIAGREDAAEVWEGLSLGHRREIIRAMVDVELLRAGPGVPFDPRSVKISRKTG